MNDKFKLAAILAAVVAHDVHREIKAYKFRHLAQRTFQILEAEVVNQQAQIQHLCNMLDEHEVPVTEFDRIVLNFNQEAQED